MPDSEAPKIEDEFHDDAVLATCRYCGHLYDVTRGFPVDEVCSLHCGVILAWERQVTDPPEPDPTMKGF